jgi:hypothetical protein
VRTPLEALLRRIEAELATPLGRAYGAVALDPRRWGEPGTSEPLREGRLKAWRAYALSPETAEDLDLLRGYYVKAAARQISEVLIFRGSLPWPGTPAERSRVEGALERWLVEDGGDPGRLAAVLGEAG